MKIFILLPDKQPEIVEAGDHIGKAREVIGDMIDFTKVIWEERLCHAMVDDLGHPKGLPVNQLATDAYHRACIPGTTHQIVGPMVIFDGLLP